MNLTRNGVTIQVDDAEIVNMLLQRFGGGAAPTDLRGISVPRIGSVWPGQGGTYAGIMRGRNGEMDYHLIVGNPIAAMTWGKAKTAATDMVIDGHKDFTLPFRSEQALQFANVPELFEKEWYWSSEQHAELAVYAWMQGFDYGGQGSHHKDSEWRARAVRRLIIQ